MQAKLSQGTHITSYLYRSGGSHIDLLTHQNCAQFACGEACSLPDSTITHGSRQKFTCHVLSPVVSLERMCNILLSYLLTLLSVSDNVYPDKPRSWYLDTTSQSVFCIDTCFMETANQCCKNKTERN